MGLHSVIIVDDEKIIREGLRNVVNWEQLGFRVGGAFCNGLEAFNHIRATRVDVVLADIRMPRVDGLQLAERIKTHHLDTRVVFLSGHDKFEFARRAVDADAVSYLLKPVKEERIIAVFTRLKHELERRDAEKEQNRAAQIVNLSRGFAAVIAGGSPPRHLQSLILESARQSAYAILLLEYLPATRNYPEKLARWAAHLDSTQAHFRPAVVVATVVPGNANLCAELIGGASTEDALAKAAEHFEHCSNRLDSRLVLTGGLSDGFVSFERLAQAVSLARNRLSGRVHGGVGQLYDTSPSDHYGIGVGQSIDVERVGETDLATIAAGYVIGLETGDHALVESTQDRLLALVRQTVKNDIMDAASLISLFFVRARTASADMGFGLHNGTLASGIELQLTAGCSSLQELRERLTELSTHGMRRDGQARHPAVARAVSYILANLSGDLSLQSVAKVCQLSSTYLSRLFKTSLNINYKEFVTRTRIRTAQELLEHSSLLVYEVAHKVGIADGRYFSELFRRERGMTPSEYRRRAADRIPMFDLVPLDSAE